MRLSLFLLLSLLVPVLMMAQVPVANFTQNITKGCSPVTVQFTDQSTGSPVSYNWDFGNGQLSTSKNPNVVFQPGTYTVTLVVRNSSGVNSLVKTDLIVSVPSPNASFTANKVLTCLPADIQFSDASNANAGTINKWEWDFGDTTKDNTQNPKHTYKYPGYYGVYLKVTSTTGCSSEAFAGRYIRIVNGVKANFDFSGPTTCQPPFTLAYKNFTSGPGTLTYSWDLGNGSSSGSSSPSAIYNVAGTYTVKLKAQSQFGCSDSIQKSIPVSGNLTSFTAPASVCLGTAANFQSTASPAPAKVLWKFGDGTSSNLPTVQKTYSTPGTYTVTFYSTFANCADSATKTIVVNDKPVVDFKAPKTNTCKPPLLVTFQNTSPDAVSSNWNFGDGSTGTGHPSTSHNYTATGSYDVALTITDSKGCSNTGIKPTYVNIFGPNVQMANVPQGLCTNQSFFPQPNIGTVDPVVSYLWDFGDGATSTAMSPSHSYTTAGNYSVKLTATTADGCTVTSPVSIIQVGAHPNIDFSVNTASACRSELFTFTNLTTPTQYAAVIWDFDDGTFSGSITNPLQHKFADTGLHSIKLTITSFGCVDSLTKTDFVRVLPPVANFDYIVDCVSKTAVKFIDSSKIDPSITPVSYLWDFGGATPATSASAPPITVNYPAGSAPYNVKLIVTNGTCKDTITKKIQLVSETAKFTINKKSFCRNELVVFSAGNTAAYISKYDWIIDGAPAVSGQSVYSASFTTTGPHSVQLVTTDINGCVTNSGTPATFNITGPTASFTVANNAGCSNKSTIFNDASISTGTITKWTYNFGDGSTNIFNGGPFTHTYADTGIYQVQLSVIDNIGCVDTFRVAALPVSRPTSFFSTDKTLFCPSTPMQFIDSSSGKKLTYSWNFGDGTTDNAAAPSHTYPNADSVYTVTLAVQDSLGCTDTLSRNKYVTIRSPKAFYSVKDTVTLCPPLETKFAFKGKDQDSFAWDFGDGSDQSQLDSTSHFYNTYGNFVAKLYAYGAGGCADSASINIRVTNPYTNTTVTFDPKTACNDLTVNFNVTTPFGTGFQLNFGDGAGDNSQQTSFSHFYSLPNVYSPAILLYDSTGCQVYFGNFGTVDIRGAVPIFGIDKDKFCDSGTVYFTDYSQQARDPITNKTWDFGDGVTSNSTSDVIHTYTTPGLFVPTLTVTAGGCDKTFTDTVRVLATPKPVITSADAICNNLLIDFAGSLLVPPDTAIQWKWDLSKGQTSTQQNVSVNYPDTGVHHITLQAVNSLGCKGDTSKDIIVNPLPAITVSGDTSIISGAGGITIPLTYSANATAFNWTPAKNLSCTNCGNPFATPKFTTTYNVVVTDANGCISSRNVTLVVICNNKNFFIPNTFSPNNDGANDQFYPRGTGLDRIQALRIFNRWGELVFEKRNFPANDAASGWDGNYKGKTAPADTYIYMIDIICENATIITYKGNITLIR